MDSIESYLRKLIVASVGAADLGCEKLGKLLDECVARGEVTVEKGRVLNEELKRTCKQAAARDADEKPAVDVDATNTSVSAAIVNTDGTVTVQLLEVLDGTGMAPAEITRICDTYHAPLVMDCKGPNADLHDRLASMTDEAGDPLIDFIAMQSSDYLAVGQAFVSGLRNKLIRHAADTELDASAANCARTWSGDAWRVTRRGSTGLTSPIESCMLAAWGAHHLPSDGTLQIF